MNNSFTAELLDLIRANHADGHRPLLFANARIITEDPLVGDFARADVLLGGARIVGIGPGLLTAADDDGAIVIDCDGSVLVPAVVDVARLEGLRAPSYRSATALAPGNPGTFAILPAAPEEADADALRRFLQDPGAVIALVIDGEVVVWNSKPVNDADRSATEATTETSEIPADILGTWIDENDFVHQHLTADGRYDETRGGRPHAFQGSYWVSGSRIDYLDDLGFWAFGEFIDGVLHHAGYTFHRS